MPSLEASNSNCDVRAVVKLNSACTIKSMVDDSSKSTQNKRSRRDVLRLPDRPLVEPPKKNEVEKPRPKWASQQPTYTLLKLPGTHIKPELNNMALLKRMLTRQEFMISVVGATLAGAFFAGGVLAELLDDNSDSEGNSSTDDDEPIEATVDGVLESHLVTWESDISPEERAMFLMVLETSVFDHRELLNIDQIMIRRSIPGSGVGGTSSRGVESHGFPGMVTVFVQAQDNRTQADWINLFVITREILGHEFGHQFDYPSDNQAAISERIEFGDGLIPNELRLQFSSIVGLPTAIADPWFISGEFEQDPPGSSLWAEYVGKLIYDTELSHPYDVAELEGDALHACMEWLAFKLDIPRGSSDFLTGISPLPRLPYAFVTDEEQIQYQQQQVVPWLEARGIGFDIAPVQPATPPITQAPAQSQSR